MPYPNADFWSALKSGVRVAGDAGKPYALSVVTCGLLKLPSGQLVACDPFAGLQPKNNLFVQVPPGSYEVKVTLADVSDALDGSHIREAYATLIIDPIAQELRRRIITPLPDGKTAPPEIAADGTYYGFPVDAGTACFVDNQAIATSMPDGDWYNEVFDNGTPDSWFSLMDHSKSLRDGIANIVLPLAKNGENIVICHSGWGDGRYPVIGSYDEKDRLIAIHIDFMVVFRDA